MNIRVSGRRRVQPWLLVLTGFSCFFASAAFGNNDADEQRARDILRQIDDMWRQDSSHARLAMEVKTRHYTRTLRLEAWSRGADKSLIRILFPAREKGTASLKSGEHLYTYLPKTDRTIRLSAGMMSGSWMGSHFTNDDLVQDSRRERDYRIRISFEGKRNGLRLMEFTLVPRETAAVVWGKVVTTVSLPDYLPVSEVFYDEAMKVARTLEFSDIRLLGGRKMPSVLKVVPADKPDEYTVLTYEHIEFNIGIKNEFFSLNRLRMSR
ncbi:MAG: outer membrane lipoprotein-sorting protein [Gammaproteobacteria bacterium]|nr:outer membrane lipoprotein-sorting protein [Gammaproteobacteria bacterium]